MSRAPNFAPAPVIERRVVEMYRAEIANAVVPHACRCGGPAFPDEDGQERCIACGRRAPNREEQT